MRAREVKKRDRESRALLVLNIVEKALKASGEIHARLKVTNDILIATADDVLSAPSK